MTAAFVMFEVEILPSTYILTAFCVGNNISLEPNVVVVDLFAASSFNTNAAVVAVAFEVTVFCSVVMLFCKITSAASPSVSF